MELVYKVNDKPSFGKVIVFALQQLLAILAATIAVPAAINGGKVLPADFVPMSQSAALFGAGGVPVEGQMDGVGFCATQQPGGDVRVHWVQVNRQRIPVDAVV